MRKSLGALAAFAISLAASSANAQTWYAGGYGALNYTHDGSVTAFAGDAKYDLGLGIAGYIGFFVQDNIRIEGELSYRANDIDSIGGPVSGDVETLAVMANALIDFKLESNFEPYLGAGLGLAEVEYRIGVLGFDDTVLAVQMIAGLGVELSPTVELTVDYRLFMTEDVRVGAFGEAEYVNSAVAIGLRKAF